MTPELHAACERAVHVVAPDGAVTRAGRAALLILELIGYRPLARFLSLPPMIWVVEIGYKIVAANRPFFARFLFTKEYEATGDADDGRGAGDGAGKSR
jgi:predicted DCC family thiol-disulfide oxidoreductase YuxK